MSRKIVIPIVLILLALAIYLSFEMRRLPLWGWRPMFLFLSIWGAFVLATANRFTKHPKNLKLLGLATLSGLIFSAGFPSSPLTPLMFIAWIPLLLIEKEVFDWDKRARRWVIWKYAFHAFFIWNVISTFWVANTSFLPGLVANSLNAAIMATVFMFFHISRSFVDQKWYIWVLGAYWISFEYLHLFWDISWPWLTLGNSFAQYPSWIQWYEFTGVFGGSVWILVVNYLIYQQFQKFITKSEIKTKSILIIAAVLLIPIALSLILRERSLQMPVETGVEIAIVQPNFEPHYQKFSTPKRDQLNRFLRLSDSIVTDQTEYLVFPETSFGYLSINNLSRESTIRQLQQFVDKYEKLNLVTGIASLRDFQPNEEHPSTVRKIERSNGPARYLDIQNSAIQITSNRTEIPYYFKSKLVPGPEFFPFRKILPFIKPLIEALDGTIEGHAKQKERSVFYGENGVVAPAICYESIYGEYVGGYIKKGADMIFVVTNDGWWDDTPGHVQHLYFSTLRAIEHRRPIARSANTGTSAFITPEGKILDATDYEVTTAIRRVVYPRKDITFYTIWGDLIARISVFFTVLIFTFTLSSIWKKRVGVKE